MPCCVFVLLVAELAMGCKTSAKGERATKGTGKGNGTKGKGKGMGSGGAGGGSAADKLQKQIASMTTWMQQATKKQDTVNAEQNKTTAKLLALLGAKAAPGAAAAAAAAGPAKAAAAAGSAKAACLPHWTCGSCGDPRCFANREVCHKCSAPRVAVAAAAAAGPEVPPGLAEMDLDVADVDIPLEEQILSAEADVKQLQGSKSANLKAQLAASVAALQRLREQQRKERPLPARLQSATHRLEKEESARAGVAAAMAAGELALAELAAAQAVLKTQLTEADGKVLEAQAELQGVRQQIAAGQTDGLASSLQQVFGLHLGLAPQQADYILQQVLLQWGIMAASGGPGLLLPPPAAFLQQVQPQPAAGLQQVQPPPGQLPEIEAKAQAAALETMAAKANVARGAAEAAQLQAQAAQLAAAKLQAEAEAQVAVATQAAQVAAVAQGSLDAAAAAADQRQQQHQQRQLLASQAQQQQHMQMQLQVQQQLAAKAKAVEEAATASAIANQKLDGVPGLRPGRAAGAALRAPSGSPSEADASDGSGDGRSRSRKTREKKARAAAKAAAKAAVGAAGQAPAEAPPATASA